MQETGPIEDEWGVDRVALRSILRLTVAERVQRLVDEVQMWAEIRESAGVTRP